ncbi:hypothetical protein SGRA_1527 [Saprospira grandis str. Lewin]|uniref:Uncharacterized protein n=1 Tax=Saprospira grandis (strain Lewin) TaxID=984262 RepID=H6L990_SAPGL|nr:hypothetical protein SGRA_1527 [Saprospira grandis str. Lewin]
MQQCGEAADQGRQAAGPSGQRAAERSARSLLREAPKHLGVGKAKKPAKLGEEF